MYTVERISPATTTNSLLFAGGISITLYLLGVLPFLLAESSWWALTLLPMPWIFLVYWALIHEAVHKMLLPTTHANDLAGRILSIGMGSSFHVLRFGHLMHHKLNRHWQSEYVDEMDWKSRVRYYWNLLAGLYFTEIAASFLLALIPNRHIPYVARRYFFQEQPDVATAGERFFLDKGNINYLRLDVIAIVALYAGAFALYGAEWMWLVGIIALRAFVISFMDNFYHYLTPEDNSRAGKEIVLPAWVSRALLNSNFHETHHLHPNLPWHKLPELKPRHEPEPFLKSALIQFSGPLLRADVQKQPQSIEQSESLTLVHLPATASA